MPLSDFATISITTSNPGLTLAGFGIDLIVSATAAWVERTRTYNGIVAVGGDWAPTTPEWQAANALFAQSPAPPTIMIGRAANKPTQIFTITLATVVSVAGQPYTVRLNNLGAGAAGAAAGVKATFTTVGSDTNDTIVAGLVSAINALSLSGVTASSTGSVGTKIVTITLSTAGAWLGVEVFDNSIGAVGGLMLLAETESDAGITADLIAINNESKVWYGLTLLFKSSAIIAAAATWVESNTKLFIVATADTVVATVADGSASDIAHVLKAAARIRTGVMFHPRNDEFADAATVGRFFPINPGGENWRAKTLSGPSAVALTDTQETNLNTKLCNFYYSVSGTGNSNSISVVGGQGKVASGEFIDVVRFRDWYAATLGTAIFNLQLNANKIPYDNSGIAMIQNVVIATNKLGISRQGILFGSDSVSVPDVGNVSQADKASRTLNQVLSNWTLTGAINLANITVAVSH